MSILPSSRKFSFFTLLFLVLAFLPFTSNAAFAATISAIAVTSGSDTLGATTTYTITFTPATSIAAPAPVPTGFPPMPGGFVSLSIFSQSGPAQEGFAPNLASATLGSGTTLPGTISRQGMTENSATGFQLSGGLSAGTSYTIVLNNVVNPGRAGVYQAMVNTSSTGGMVDEGRSSNFYIGLGPVTKTISGKVSYPGGSGVSTAQINAMQTSGPGGAGGLFLNVNTNAAGNYSVSVPGGDWQVNLSAQFDQTTNQPVAVDWAYLPQGPPPSVSFKKDATTETSTVNFSVVKATATVKGKVLFPDGRAFNNGGFDLRQAEGAGVGGGMSSDGSFLARVPAGTYTFAVFSQDENYAAPQFAPFKVGDGETKDLGTIILVLKNEFVKGAVTDKDTGAGIANVEVNAWSPTGAGFSRTTTAVDGSYTLKLTPGEWEFMPRPDPSSNYTFEQTGPPERITLIKDQTITGKNFKLTKADATISGTVVDAAGNLISDLFAFAMAMKGTDPPMPGPGGEVRGGQFTIRVPAGAYSVNVFLPPNADYSSAGSKTVTVVAGQTGTVQITLKKNDAFISGTIVDSAGNAVVGVRLEVGGHSPSGAFKNAMVDPNSGTYRMGVVGGESWFLGVFVDPKSGYMMLPPDDNKVTPKSGETVTKNFTLLKADATVKVTVKDPNASALSNVFVFADSNAGKTTGGKGDFKGPGLHTGDLVGASGTIELKVAAGTWGVGSGAPPSLGYINPEIQVVTIASGETKELTLQYKASDGKISGSLYLSGQKTHGFVWAWSEKGGYSETMSFSGDYTLNVTKNDIWHIGADLEKDGKIYRSSESVVTVGDSGQASQDLTLTEAPWAVPESISQTISATQAATITLRNGMTINIPASAIATSGNITITVNPTTQLAKQKASRPVAFGYEIKAFNSSGQEITSKFNSDVTITMPYTDAMLADLGIGEGDLAAAYFDTTSTLWQGITSYVIDKDNNKVIITVDHFTAFSLVTGSADTTPPSNPTSVTVTDRGGGVVRISWTNPTDSDFDHVNIYRSTASGVLGDKVTSTTAVTATSHDDSGLTAGTYYYSLKAADKTGNLSSGTNQSTITLTSGVTTTTPTPTPTPQALPATGVPVSIALGFYREGILIFLASLLGLLSPRILLLRRLG